ncbi:Arpin [Acanthosepion pharaonis]|uniref:Arpin n=1 Tax=Acanthosepion pharaonis TaxID=158019 RepID=A0A812D9A7_ACAPH|nr:Arpin [Sepia pharaonis]
MSRLYDNRPLQNLPVKTINWSKVWNPSHYKSGHGFLLEGTLLRRSRFAITDKDKNKFRYIVLHIIISKAHRRKYDSSGKEIEPNFGETKKVSTGFLNSSYKVAPKGQTDCMSASQVIPLICKEELDVLTILSQPMIEQNNSMVSFWMEESNVDKIEIQDGETIRMRTAGDCPFIESFTRIDPGLEPQTVGNYSGGDQVGDGWTYKIMQLKLSDTAEASAATDGNQSGSSGISSEGMGADEDEWDD